MECMRCKVSFKCATVYCIKGTPCTWRSAKIYAHSCIFHSPFEDKTVRLLYQPSRRKVSRYLSYISYWYVII